MLHEGCAETDPVKRRRKLYAALKEALGGEVEGLTVIDMGLDEFLSPSEVTPLLLNIYWDGLVLLDLTGRVQGFLSKAKERIAASGLKRIKDGKAYCWSLPQPMREVEVL